EPPTQHRPGRDGWRRPGLLPGPPPPPPCGLAPMRPPPGWRPGPARSAERPARTPRWTIPARSEPSGHPRDDLVEQPAEDPRPAARLEPLEGEDGERRRRQDD